jgi:hypothetical protein
MENITNYKHTPIGSLITKSDTEGQAYIERLPSLPAILTKVIFSSNTGAYVQGLAKSYDVTEDASPAISFTILRVMLGDISLIQLSETLSKELGIASDKAQKMAIEIEKDLFGPVKKELEEFWASQKSQPAPLKISPKQPVSPQNILNLKEITAAKKQEQLAAKPQQKILPPRTPHPNPLPIRGEGSATLPPSPPKFPLPPKPPTTPIRFSE